MTATAARPESTVSAWRSPLLSSYLLSAATGILVLVGLAVVLSSSSIVSIRVDEGNAYGGFVTQLIALAVGMTALVLGARMPVAFWKKIAPVVLYGSIALLLVVLATGFAVGGNKAWIRIGGFSLQPSEIAKLGLALYLGAVLSRFRHRLTNPRDIMLSGGLMAAVVIGLVLAGRDMGTAMILMVLVVVALWVAGVPTRFFGLAAIVGIVGLTMLVFAAESRVARIEQWFTGECVGDACWQQTHGTWALASGGLWGLGPGMSREKWGWLPASDNDYIYAIIGEEFGLLGTLLILAAFAMILIAVTRIVTRSTDRFAQIAGAAIGGWILVQACVNIAVVLELLPVTGVPLPLVSAGGSSLIMSLTAMGVLLSFARHEPGAPEALAARPSLVRRSLSVLSKGRRRG